MPPVASLYKYVYNEIIHVFIFHGEACAVLDERNHCVLKHWNGMDLCPLSRFLSISNFFS